MVKKKAQGDEKVQPEGTTDILEALKASLKVKGKPESTIAKAKGKIGMAVSK